MEIYIKPVEKAQIVQKRTVLLRDVAEVYAGGMAGEVELLPVFQVPEGAARRVYLLSVLDIIRAIVQHYPQANVSNLGEGDILIDYLPQAEKKRPFWTGAKVAFVALTLFVGASTTIMCFHSDTQLPLIFRNIYYMLYGERREMPALLSIPYSIGLGGGILIFFNHFSRFYLTQDPTPIEIEMTTYEKETNAGIIDYLNRQKGGER